MHVSSKSRDLRVTGIGEADHFPACQYGFGRHFVLIDPADRYEAMKVCELLFFFSTRLRLLPLKLSIPQYFYICQITYKASINLTKASILLLYLRIFGNIRWFKWCCWFLLASVIIYCVASVAATIWQCTPIVRAFDKTVDGTCIDNIQFWYANAGFSIATDVVILLLPMYLVYQLHIPIQQKLALIVVFALGVFVLVTSILRITTIEDLSQSDITYENFSTMWTIIEPNVAVLCACLPMIRPFLVKFFPKFMSRGTGSGGNSSNKRQFDIVTYGSKSNNTGRGSQLRGKEEWMELEGRNPNTLHMTTVERNPSVTGSDEEVMLDAARRSLDRAQEGIQKTVQYTVEYSSK